MACPVRALHEWLEAARIVAGTVFRPINRHRQIQPRRLSDQTVATIVKNQVTRLGLDPSRYSGHSLRAGFATSAAAQGASLFKLMDVTRHKKVDSLRDYVRDAELFKDHAGASGEGPQFESSLLHHAVCRHRDFPQGTHKRRRLARISPPPLVSACRADLRQGVYSTSVSGHRNSFPHLQAGQTRDAFAIAGDWL
jgi:hypothetical protein